MDGSIQGHFETPALYVLWDECQPERRRPEVYLGQNATQASTWMPI
jgi:hypothetical protein